MSSGDGGASTRRSNGPSMVDVGRRAGVAVGTVSNTLNNPAVVAEGTRLRVLAAIKELGFVRNDAARSLITGSSDIVGLVIVDLRDPYFVDVARGVEAELQENGMRLLIADSDRLLDKQRQNIQLFEHSRVAGIVVAPVVPAKAGAPWSRTGPCPLVLVDDDSCAAGGGSMARLGGWMGRAAARRLLDRIRARNRELAGAT